MAWFTELIPESFRTKISTKYMELTPVWLHQILRESYRRNVFQFWFAYLPGMFALTKTVQGLEKTAMIPDSISSLIFRVLVIFLVPLTVGHGFFSGRVIISYGIPKANMMLSALRKRVDYL